VSSLPTCEELKKMLKDLDRRITIIEAEHNTSIRPQENESFEEWLQRLRHEAKETTR